MATVHRMGSLPAAGRVVLLEQEHRGTETLRIPRNLDRLDFPTLRIFKTRLHLWM